VNSIVACCHSAKLCTYAARDFRSQQDKECSRLHKEYLNADSPDTIHSSASALTDLIDKKRHDRWIDTVGKIDFTHSSRKAWMTLTRLTGTVSAKKLCLMSPDDIGTVAIGNPERHVRKASHRDSKI